MSYMLNSGLLGNKNQFFSLSFSCTGCKSEENKILPFPIAGGHADKWFEIIHNDVRRITPIISHAYYNYFVIFIDDHSQFT